MDCKLSVLAVLLGVAAVVLSADEKSSTPATEAEGTIKIYRRLIPADVLRDFPGLCFASTKCATVEPGHTWELSPFCGRSTCVLGEGTDRLLELVEDCGPNPKPNPKCKVSEKTNKTAAFPECCPVFDCEPGVKLEYPEITVIENSESTEGSTTTTTEKPKA
ncbi:Single domain Von Willebrand factor type C domain [Cinara cedri]|uniref:Single domain Von Willebrand factor type C domain n=1 Tax=Cinara cedri TaxID=506608 RepID=A0A5E4NHA9_9HEMI|nr:Single domain Von Willebrand factor type C domain [Cinara cedri]